MQVLLPTPVLLESDMEAIKTNSGLPLQTFGLHYKSGEDGAMADALRTLCSDVEKAVQDGCDIVVLSDRLEGDMEADRPPIPTLLAVGAVHHHLIRHVPRPLGCPLLCSVPTTHCWGHA